MQLEIEPYLEQCKSWPKTGKCILAQYDASSVVVYQAYNKEIGHFAAKNGFFGGSFKHSRMTWIKPNFLWMMYRSGWGTKVDQEVTLAIRLKREGFEQILVSAVASSFGAAPQSDQQAWKADLQRSTVRLQWDPDHTPSGSKTERRAIQLGLRGEATENYSREWILGIEDISDFVEQQRASVKGNRLNDLVTPRERVYPVVAPEACLRLGM